jgi:hypothetical protein
MTGHDVRPTGEGLAMMQWLEVAMLAGRLP